MTKTQTTVSPAAISRILNNAGIGTTQAAHRFKFDGIFVAKGVLGTVIVYLDLTDSARSRYAEQVTEVITSKGYTVERHDGDRQITVSH